MRIRLRHNIRRSRRASDTPDDPDTTADADDCIAAAPDRTPVRLTGTLRTVSLCPRGGVPALEAELDDGTGTLTLIWLGRRRILGVTPGRSMQVTGRIGRFDGQRILYNPRFELLQ